MKHLPALLPLLLSLSNAVNAQPMRFESVPSNLPPNLAGACMDSASGDADGDGDLDLALAMEFQRNRLLLNNGMGSFIDATPALPDAEHDSEDVAFVDVDNDADLDLFFVSEDDRIDELYLNDGKGRYTDASDRLFVTEVANGHAVLDLDGDGAMDLLFGNVGPDAVLLNNGDGTFVDATSARWPQTVDSRTQDLELFDADNDGDLDLAVANEGQNQLYLNQDGVFVDVTLSNLPQRDDETREIRAVDIDGDGDLDLAVANVAFLTQGTAGDYILLNDGTGNFTVSALAFPEDARSNFTVQTIDIDRDGDADLLLPSTVFPTNEQTTYMMATGPDGARHLYRINQFGIDDRDGDGDMDIFSSIDTQEFTFTNEGDNFSLKNPGEPPLVPVTPDKLDFDDNGTNELTIWSATFNLQNQDDAILSQNNLEFYDVDDNGSVEVVSVVQSAMRTVGDSLLLLNDGTGAFTRAEPNTYFPASANGNGFDIEVADFNGDVLDDMFFCNRASSVDKPAESGGQPQLLLGI